jgi:ABC-type transport system involved in multi-copper enzyme maturation permease subunit
MSYPLTVLVVILLIATVGSLFGGLFSMGVGGETDDRNSTRLMFTRVGLQGLAVALIALMLFVLHR